MGKLIYSLSVSLDGFAESSGRSLDWVQVDEELHTFFNNQSREIGASLYGRRMYELMFGYWPMAGADPAASPAEVEFAGIWKRIPRIVFSTTLDQVDPGSRLVRSDPAKEVARLKAQSGNDMDVGGPTLASTLMRAGLIDEYRLFVHPVILGAGTPFFTALDARIPLRLPRPAPSAPVSSTSATRQPADRSYERLDWLPPGCQSSRRATPASGWASVPSGHSS